MTTRGMTTLVSYGGRIAAFCGPNRVNLAPWLQVRERGDPELRVVSMMCLYSREVREGRTERAYEDADAELFARCALIDDAEFEALAEGDDADLAERFAVPVEQIAGKRGDLRAVWVDRSRG